MNKRVGVSGGGFLADTRRRQPIPFDLPRSEWPRVAERQARVELQQDGGDVKGLPLYVKAALEELEQATCNGLYPPGMDCQRWLYEACGRDLQTGERVTSATTAKSMETPPPKPEPGPEDRPDYFNDYSLVAGGGPVPEPAEEPPAARPDWTYEL